MSWLTTQYNINSQELHILLMWMAKHCNRSQKQNSGLGVYLSSLTKIILDTRFGAYLSLRFFTKD